MDKIIVVFEVTPTEEGKKRYLELASMLKPLLSETEGYIGGERYQSLINPNKVLSINIWENEEAVKRWRNQTEHRMAQLEGKQELFKSYKITVANIRREYTSTNRDEAPSDSNEYFNHI